MKRAYAPAVFALLAFAAVISGIFTAADRFAEDVLYHRADGAVGNIKIIGIDDKSRLAYGDPSTWNRALYAQLIETLCPSEEIRPAVIGFDMLFDGTREPEGDSAFAAACAEYGNAVCAFNYRFGTELAEDGYGRLTLDNLSVAEKPLPYGELLAAVDTGFANAYPDGADSVLRKAFYGINDGEGTEYSFGAQVYRKYSRVCGREPEAPPTDSSGVFSFRYSGKPSDYETVSLCDVLDGSVPAEAFGGCIVLVGACAAGMQDEFSVPTARGSRMYGVEINANVIQALMEHKYIRRISVWLSAALCALACGLTAFVSRRLRVGHMAAVCIGAAAVKLIAGGILFGAGISGNVIVFPAMCIVICGYYTGAHYYEANRAKRRIENAFRKYVAPQIVEKIAGSGTYTLKLGGENRDIAVLFVDIRGFTPLSESLEPEQVVDILNSYLELTTNCIFRYGGTLDKFVGDATMAVFNAPFDTEDYVFRALMTAWDIVAGGSAIESEFMEKYGKAVGFGVGVNCGPAVVGNIGSSFRMDYTAIGDTVNTAARLEANAPRGKVYISGEVYEQVKDYIRAEEMGTIPLKGKSKDVFVYSVTEVDGERIRNEKNIDNTGS